MSDGEDEVLDLDARPKRGGNVIPPLLPREVHADTEVLVRMGFSLQRAAQALEITNGNLEAAVALLLDGV